jgi:hypothetical protein
MKNKKIDRRLFIRNTTLAATGMALAGKSALAGAPVASKNKLPRWKGFNVLDYFGADLPQDHWDRTTEDDLKWMADWGFNFVRIPMAYPRYISFDRSKKITPQETCNFDRKVIDDIQKLAYRINSHGLHVSLAIHRGPGFCINAGFNEPFNLWKDKEAQDAFNQHWGMWAETFKGVSADKVSFDLLNEPVVKDDMNDQYSKSGPVPGETYRLIVADGNNGGSNVTPELIDLGLAQSCRAYYPHYISHYQASWVWKDPSKAPKPVYPGVIDGKRFDRKVMEDFYKPWLELAGKGVGVHCGEGGCFSLTPHDVFLAWFGDILDILTPAGIGYALWNFRGAFGIMDSGRKDIKYADWHGHQLDSKLLDLLKKY